MTSYRDHPYAHAQNRPRPLIEQIPDYRDDLDVSDEEDGFYARDDDFLIPPKFQAAITRTTDRIPRRIKRHSGTYLVIAILFIISWFTYLGPKRTAHKMEIHAMDNVPTKTSLLCFLGRCCSSILLSSHAAMRQLLYNFALCVSEQNRHQKTSS